MGDITNQVYPENILRLSVIDVQCAFYAFMASNSTFDE